MRRYFRGLLVGVLTLWIPIDSAVAGWWHHHRHAMPVARCTAFPPPCDAGGPVPGWANAIVIDDRPLGRPSPIAAFAAPPAGMVLDSCVATGPVEGSIIDEGTVVHEGTFIHEGTVVHEGSTPPSNVIDTDEPIPTQRPIDAPKPPTRDVNTRVETTPEDAESPTSLELPGTAATTSGDPAAAAQPGPVDEPASSVLEPWEPKTVQGDTAAETATDEPAATMEEAEALKSAETPADINATDEPLADTADVDSTPQPQRRNLFDEAQADEAEGFESPRTTEDSLSPSDAFEAPGTSDDDFGIPDEAPMDDGDEMPADDFGDDSGAPASDDSGFEPATEEPMDDAPVDEPMEEGIEGEPGVEGEPGIEGEPEPLEEEVPAASDPFDTSVFRTPSQPMREWRDDTGRHGTEGRLVEVHADRVRILKVSGRHTAVPMARLSRADQDHVAAVALALGLPAARPGETAGL